MLVAGLATRDPLRLAVLDAARPDPADEAVAQTTISLAQEVAEALGLAVACDPRG